MHSRAYFWLLPIPDDLDRTCQRIQMAQLGYADQDVQINSDQPATANDLNKIDSAVRKTVEFIRDYRDGVIHSISGNEDFAASVWAHARMANVVILDSAMTNEARRDLSLGG